VRVGRIVGEVDELRADHGVCLGRDDADVCHASMGSRDVNFHVDGLTRGICLHIGRCIVGEKVSLAEVDLALSGVEVCLALSYLKDILDVALYIGGLVVIDLDMSVGS